MREQLDKSWSLLEHQATHAPGELAERLRVLFGKQGKRVRSTLLLLTADLGAGASSSSALQAAASIELLHLASLAHDDVIDDSEIRRGEASAPSRWGNQMAVLVGDYAFARSMRLAIDSGSTEIVDIINTTSCMLTAGEVAELDLSRSPSPSLDAYREVIHLKTACLLETCCLCGAIAGNLEAPQREAMGKFGRHFGMAFQMCDDLLDLGAVPDLDKPVRADISNGLINLPALLSREIAGEELGRLGHLSTPDLLRHLAANGVLGRAKELVLEELQMARQQLRSLPGNSSRKHLENLVVDLGERLTQSLGGI